VIVETTMALGIALFLFYLGYFSLLFILSRNKSSLNVSGRASSFPFVSVVVAIYNEEDTIVQKLKNLIEQDYPSMEVIVVDSASKDRTVSLITKFMKSNKADIKLIQEKERKGKASALNLSQKYCTGEIIVITDADASWGKDTLKKIVANFSDASIGAVSGKQVLLNPCQSLATNFEKSYRSIFEILRIGESRLDSTPIFNGPLMAFRSDLLGPIPEDTMADDSMLAVEIRKKGYKSVYDPDAVFYEYAPPTFKSRRIQKLRRAQGLVQLFLRQRELLFNRKYGKFGMIVFPAEFFMHVVSPIMLPAFLVFLICGLLAVRNYLLIGIFGALLTTFCALVILRVHKTDFILTFLDSQFTLLFSILYHALGKSQHKWEKVKETRGLWKDKTLLNNQLEQKNVDK